MRLAEMERRAHIFDVPQRPIPPAIRDLMGIESRRWKQINNKLRQDGDPQALAGGFAGLELTPSPSAAPVVTGGATELLLWPGATYTPIPANPQTPKVYELHAWGTMSTAATPGTYTLNPRMGTLITSPSMGATNAITPTASQTTAPWFLMGKIIVRTGGSASVATGSFLWLPTSTTSASGNFSGTVGAVIGGVSATFDSTVASALVFGWIVTTSTTNTITPQGIVWGSWN